ncbi:hypothetical protein Taro_047464 [Colocasia esculenta]|uniref:Aminotransferase-like plant mobile domain-containing protein n=1 Tax=Colocasia esculenta TaxID=4460 RepID=A0A843X3X1_COLES|nr:hypothetical protein [Colocasia esculenta]
MESKAVSIMSPSSPPCESASSLLPALVPPPKRRSKHCVRIQFNLLEAEQIILGWKGEDLFKFGRTIIPFTADDVALILGVPSVGRHVPISGPVQKSVLHSQFSNTEKFDREGIKKLFHGIIKSNETDDVANTVRLWILLLLSTFLVPRTNFTCPPQMLHCLDDQNRVKDFAWADGFQKLILNKMGDAHEAAMNKICGVKTLAKWNYKSDLEGKRFIYGCSAALCMTPNNSCAQVWLLEHTRLQRPMNKIVFPRILRWEGQKKRKVQVRAENIKTEQILLSLIPHSEEEWLLSGLESSTKVVEGGEQEEEEERQENKKEKDREESEETGEMSPSKWSTVMSEMRNELTCSV